MSEENNKKQEDKTSTEATIKAGKAAVDAAKQTAPTEDEKNEDAQKKDAENWRNEG